MRATWLMVALWACGSDDGDPLEVQLDTGGVLGTAQGETRMFRGIPFAAPPIGENRWRAPQPAIPWEGTIETIEFGRSCAQPFTFLGDQSEDEDCLTLNVWTPNGADDVPVLVWFHGGGFLFGSANVDYYDGRILAETQNVAVVTVNYRLNTFGFLAHPDLPGANYGLQDQLAALEWVQRNIAAFGGDPTRVTIFGESAGGISTCLHYVSPNTAGLFHAAISQSGLCTDDTLLPTAAVATANGIRVAEALGCTTDVAACMRGKTSTEILEATAGTPIADQVPGGAFYVAADDPISLPHVDGTVIPTSLPDAFAAGGFEPRPLLLGTNKDEGTLFHNSLTAKEITTAQELRAALGRRFGEPRVDEVLAEYALDAFPTLTDLISEISGDYFFVCPTRRAARAAAAEGAAVYAYSLERPLEAPTIAGLGVFHASDIPFVFGGTDFQFGRVGAGEPTAVAMRTAWAQFAASGSPGADWPVYDNADTLLVLDNAPVPRSGHKVGVCDFWDAF